VNPLSKLLTTEITKSLRSEIERRRFPGLTMETAMSFLLTDGVFPESGLPVKSFLDLEDWLRARARENPATVTFSATDLKNRTGDVLHAVMSGQTVTIERHGRAVAVIHPADRA